MIETKTYRLTPARYVRQAIPIWLADWWWVLCAPMLVLLIMSLRNHVYYILMLAFLCIMLPAVLMIVYYSHALRPEAAFSTVPHTVRIDGKNLVITYSPVDEMAHIPAPRIVNIAEVSGVEDNGKSVIINLKSSKYDFIEVPINVIPPEKTAEFIKILHQN